MTEMTSRERVTAALNHEEPDRVPLDIGGGQSTSLAVEAYERLKQRIGVTAPGGTILMEYLRVARLDRQTMAYLGSDVHPVTLKPPRNWTQPHSDPGTYVDEFGIKWRQAPYAGGFYWEQATFPLAEATVADLDAYPWPDPDDPGRYEGLADEVQDLYQHTSYALLGDCGFKNHWEPVFLLCGMERALTALLLEPDFFVALMDRLAELNMAVTKRFLEIAGPYLAAFRTSDDIATQETLLMSPATYRKMIKPYHARYFTFVKQWTNARIFYHCCGNVVPVLDDLIEAGIEILNPLQASAFDDPAAVKDRFGDRLSFWGGIDTQDVLPRGTPEQVRAEMRLRIRQFGRGGGYVLAPVHNIQADVPAENVLAISQAVRELGTYPIH